MPELGYESGTSSQRPATRKSNRRALIRAISIGASVGILCGIAGMAGFVALGGTALRDVSPTMSLLGLPAAGALFGVEYRRWHDRRHGAPSGSAAETPSPTKSLEFLRARRPRYLAVGFGAGCGAAIVATAFDFAWRGWVALAPDADRFNLGICSPTGLHWDVFHNREADEGMPLRRYRLKVGTLMGER
jgi:hypothetical protein